VSEQRSLIISVEPRAVLSSRPHDEPPTVWQGWVMPACCICRAPVRTTTQGDRSYLVLATPSVIMNDIRLRGLAVAGTDAADRKSPHNHAQTARNLRRSLRSAAAGARLIEQRGWTANRLPTSQLPLLMPSKSFNGSSAASIDVSDATRDG
jgi:hypothetical protein